MAQQPAFGGSFLAPCCCPGGGCLSVGCCAYAPSSKAGYCACWQRSTCHWRCACCCSGCLGVLIFAIVVLCISTAVSAEVDCAKQPGFAAGGAASSVPVVFVPGTTATYLMSGAKFVYLTAYSAMGIGTTPLGLPPVWVGSASDVRDPSLYYQQRDGLTPGDVISWIGLPGFACYQYEVYRTLFAWSGKCLNRPFYTFPYDWRRDQYETGKLLEALVRTVSARHNSKVQLVGHSTGGGLTLALVNRAPELVHSTIYIAATVTPWWGTADAYSKPMSLGLGETSSVPASARVTLPMEMGWLNGLDPRDVGRGSFLIDSVSGAPVAIDLSNPQTWLDYKLIPGMSDASDARFPALVGGLLRAKLVRSFMQFNASLAYPPSAVITSHYNTSMLPANFSIDVASRSINFARPLGPRVAGDGSVRAADAVPPYPQSGGTFLVTNKLYMPHAALCNDVVTLKAAMDAVGPY